MIVTKSCRIAAQTNFSYIGRAMNENDDKMTAPGTNSTTKPKKFCILFEDDWEVQGNGLGNVASHQYLPTLFFMKLAKKLGIKVTFMVEVLQQLIYNQNLHRDYDLTLQKRLWDDTVRLMQEYGFDVQLHLHPQWNNPTYKDGFFHLSNGWNIGRYDKEFKFKVIGESVKYLEDLLRPINPNYKVVAFKGGSWGLQPSGDLLTALSDNGVKVVMGVRKNMKIPNVGLDYTTLEEERLPYYPVFEDLNKVSSKKEKIVIIPLQPYSPDIFKMVGLGIDEFKNRISKRDAVYHLYGQKVPQEIKSLSPLLEHSKLHFGYRPYRTHLKMGNQPFSYLKASFKNVINNLQKIDSPRIPIIIECHTKLFANYYADIEKFLYFLKENYDDVVDFGDLTSFSKELESHPEIIKMRSSAN